VARRFNDDRVRKNMAMHQRKLTQAQRLLGAANETETVDRALDLVLGRERVRKAMDRAAAAGGFHGGFGRAG
jgi:hypothetical protein